MESQHVVDESAFAALIELGGKDFAIQMIDVFLRFAPQSIEEARMGLATGNLEPVKRMGHSLRSSGTTLGILDIRDLGARIETAARENNRADLPALIKAMEDAFRVAKSYLEGRRSDL